MYESTDDLTDPKEVVLTPLKVQEGKVIKIERVSKSKLDPDQVRLFAGGPYEGIVIHKSTNKKPLKKDPEASKVFYAKVQDPKSSIYLKEKRELRFWFRSRTKDKEQQASDFFQDLLDPQHFPKDYISFLKRSLQLTQDRDAIKRLELHITTVDDDDLELDASDIKVKAITKTVVAGTVAKGLSGQEDFRSEDNGTTSGSHGEFEGVGYHTRGTGHGASLDPSQRQVKVQEDMLSQEEREALRGMAGNFHQGDSAREGLSKTLGFPDNQGHPYYAQQLLNQTFQTEHQSSANSEKVSNVTTSHKVTRTIQVKSSSTSGQTVTLPGGAGISEASARAALAAAGVGVASGRVQEDLAYDTSHGGRYTVQQAGYTGQEGVLSSGPPVPVPRKKPQPLITLKGWKVIWVAKKQKLLRALEDAYPNILSSDDIIRQYNLSAGEVEYLLSELTARGMIQEIEKGRWMRVQAKMRIKKPRPSTSRKSKAMTMEDPSKKHEFKVVAHIPRLPPNEQPSIAIITALFCEKLAVDAMMETKTTYVRYKTEGEGQVYTVGMIGKHRVVSTKLSRVGHAKDAMLSASNSVSRLLGTFGSLEHVLLVGVGGAVANLQNDLRHVRLGDVVLSKPVNPKGPIYTAVFVVDKDAQTFQKQSWAPESDVLTKIIASFESRSMKGFDLYETVQKYMKEALTELEGGETRYLRPTPDLDKVYQIFDGAEVEAGHPIVTKGSPRDRFPDSPVIHYGCIGAGAPLNKDYNTRLDFALENDVRAVDSGFEAVMDSINGNRKESFVIIRAASDYTDGTRKREWQPYAALAASAIMKALILALPTPDDDDDDY